MGSSRRSAMLSKSGQANVSTHNSYMSYACHVSQPLSLNALMSYVDDPLRLGTAALRRNREIGWRRRTRQAPRKACCSGCMFDGMTCVCSIYAGSHPDSGKQTRTWSTARLPWFLAKMRSLRALRTRMSLPPDLPRASRPRMPVALYVHCHACFDNELVNRVRGAVSICSK